MRAVLLCLRQNRPTLISHWSLQRVFSQLVDNGIMAKIVNRLFLLLLLALFCVPVVFAQDSEPAEEDDGSSEQVEQTDDAFRRQMELEDARSRDRTYVDNTYDPKADLEKIDKLPEESRDNIRDQLVDVIMENGDWEPKDALEEYPYVPSEAAQSDPDLKEREQEAWDEQIEKYHEREAAAFGSYRGPVPGPGNPTGQQGGQQGDGSQQGEQGGQQGSGQNGDGDGDGDSGKDSRGTYQPNESGSSGSDDEVSTAGVSESALDFLRGGQRQQQASGQDASQADSQARAAAEAARQAQDQAAEASRQAQAQAAMEAEQQAEAEQEESPQQAQTEPAAEQSAEQAQAEQQQESQPDTVLDTRGIIAIKDLDKLEGTEIPEDQDDAQNP